MGVAACFVSVLLASVGFFVKLTAGTLDPEFRGPILTVHIKHDEADSEVLFESVDQVRRLPLQEDASVAETVASIGKEKQKREENRASMWRKTHSLMFQSTGGIAPKQQEPIIPDFQFKPQVHVVGLGVTIGSCFIGLPIVGVPVEERTVAIRLFVCAKDAG